MWVKVAPTRTAIRRWSARNRSSRGAWVNDKLKQGTIRVPEIHADSSTAATVTLHRTRFYGDTMLGEVLRQVLDAPGPYQTQITAPRDHWWVSDQGADVETWAVDVQLLVSETEGDPTVGMVNHPRAEHVAIKGDRALPVANSDHHVVQPHMFSHVNILPCGCAHTGIGNRDARQPKTVVIWSSELESMLRPAVYVL